ncbi:helix-turn-helix domain-containing protein [Aquirufa ecclesiirivi]|uniref:helix-turn-helix domain-containing protein n=1 Tax=Aquirufa ecclesiirivi TaxID=2715124 RepID=UPI003BB0826B
MKLFFKHMVCIRCKMIVKAELDSMGLHYYSVELGEAIIEENLTPNQWDQLDTALRKSGIELLESKKSILIEKIKNIIIEQVHYVEEPLPTNLSTLLSELLCHDYTYLANLFSVSQGITIEKFYILHRVERIKELLIYDELNITEIARLMHYSSVAHMSNQFKKLTGLTPSFFKNLKNPHRISLEDI